MLYQDEATFIPFLRFLISIYLIPTGLFGLLFLHYIVPGTASVPGIGISAFRYQVPWSLLDIQTTQGPRLVRTS